MAGRKSRECIVKGDNPGTKNRNTCFTPAEWDMIKDYAGKLGVSPSLALAKSVKFMSDANNYFSEEE